MTSISNTSTLTSTLDILPVPDGPFYEQEWFEWVWKLGIDGVLIFLSGLFSGTPLHLPVILRDVPIPLGRDPHPRWPRHGGLCRILRVPLVPFIPRRIRVSVAQLRRRSLDCAEMLLRVPEGGDHHPWNCCTAPIITLFIPGTPLKTTHLQKDV